MDKYNNKYIDTDTILKSKDQHGGYVVLIQSRGYGRQKMLDAINKKFGVTNANRGNNNAKK